MRAQLNALNDYIQTRPTDSEMNSAIASSLQQTSANSNNVGQLSMSADASYQPSQLQYVIDKLDELIAAPRR